MSAILTVDYQTNPAHYKHITLSFEGETHGELVVKVRRWLASLEGEEVGGEGLAAGADEGVAIGELEAEPRDVRAFVDGIEPEPEGRSVRVAEHGVPEVMEQGDPGEQEHAENGLVRKAIPKLPKLFSHEAP